jgi:hypothetical protein
MDGRVVHVEGVVLDGNRECMHYALAKTYQSCSPWSDAENSIAYKRMYFSNYLLYLMPYSCSCQNPQIFRVQRQARHHRTSADLGDAKTEGFFLSVCGYCKCRR